MKKGIKIFLKIFFFSFLIFSCFRSCAEAYTWDDFVDFCQFTKANSINDANSSYNAARNLVANYPDVLKELISNVNYDVNDFNNWALYYSGSQNRPVIYAWAGSTTYTTNSTTISVTSPSTVTRFYFSSNQNSNPSVSQASLGAIQFCLIDGNPTNNQFYTKNIMQNYYSYAIGHSKTDWQTSNLPFYIGDGKLGSQFSYNDYKFYLINNSNKVLLDVYNNSSMQFLNGNLYQLLLTNLTGLENGIVNYISIEDSQGNSIYKSGPFALGWLGSSNEPIPIPEHDAIISGNYSSGNLSIDLTPINESINNIPDKIGKVFYNSGDSGDNGIVQKIYDDLFSLDSGDVNDVYTYFMSYVNSGDFAPVGIWDMLFGGLNNEPDDFIISWEDFNINVTSSGDSIANGTIVHASSINFSKLCRDDETFALVLFWIHTINTIFFLIAFYFSLYEAFCEMLGVTSSQLNIDLDKPEHRQIGFINDWRDKS